jgi:hypothetical protein
MWELPDEQIESNGEYKPMIISKFYTRSLGDKANLRKDLESWRGAKFTEEEMLCFDLINILGKNCFLSVVHDSTTNGNTYANVATVMAPPKGVQSVESFNEHVYFDLDADIQTIQAQLTMLPEWIQNMIKKSQTYIDLVGGYVPPQTQQPAAQPQTASQRDVQRDAKASQQPQAVPQQPTAQQRRRTVNAPQPVQPQGGAEQPITTVF